ncbi:GDSL-type esterase/lipase family protein [Basilea psittacipulmonis]|uniref:GDSL-type esterase/lipase family protein n=1 Tax=Basilea psittacipulmonis TaxID=1472345 RepID=UPI000689DAE4|nr:GDSL-type esterase/lipase family protein [Basilea psittacipulmonis]
MNIFKKLFFFIIILSITGLQLSFAANLIDYGSNKTWIQKLRQINKTGKFRIIQLGDSHTAADFFTDAVRKTLQQRYGNGGIGWVYPSKVSAQRIAAVQYSGAENWHILSSRKDETHSFPMGGILAHPQAGQASIIQLNDEHETQQIQDVSINVRPIDMRHRLVVKDADGQTAYLKVNTKNHLWQTLKLKAKFPIEISTESATDLLEIGFINIEHSQHGVVLSPMGINGAQLSDVFKWRDNWYNDLIKAQPDLIILAFGTNEAVNKNLGMEKTEILWSRVIQQMKERLPDTAILIIGAPESLSKIYGNCGRRMPSLNNVQAMQLRLAKKHHLLYWSWQSAMGGKCSMRKWIKRGLGRKDGVHFTAAGYERAGKNLAQEIIKKVSHDPMVTSTHRNKPRQIKKATPAQSSTKATRTQSSAKTAHSKTSVKPKTNAKTSVTPHTKTNTHKPQSSTK